MDGIVLKTLEWDNMFSYGKGNYINFTRDKVQQLTGPNGQGKTSISLILQEILFNKNIKKFSKGDILNREVSDNTWNGTVTFSVDSDEYEVTVKRTPTKATVSFFKNGNDISEHKVLDTYKKIEAILGDFEIFCPLLYQSSKDSLEFLKATDTNRKKFLISLFNLSKYLEKGEKIKAVSKSVEASLIPVRAELKSIQSFIDSNQTIPDYLVEITEPVLTPGLETQISQLKKEIADYQTLCSKIDRNNLLKAEERSLVFDMGIPEPERPVEAESRKLTYQNEISNNIKAINTAKAQLKTLDMSDICYTCKQPIDNSKSLEIAADLNASITKEEEEMRATKILLTEVDKIISEYNKKVQEWDANNKVIQRFEQLSQLIDRTLPNEAPDFASKKAELAAVEKKLLLEKTEITRAQSYNRDVVSNNARVDSLKEQLADFISKKDKVADQVKELEARAARLETLKKAFSSTGIVAYKLENVAKELEDSINDYLIQLSDGKYQLEFRLDGEKLNIVIVTKGKEINIETLSEGELSRVQTSMLFAVRNTLSKIGGKSINLLFLDEITGVLDASGKERLMEALMEEEGLNCFLIAHDYTNPLVPQIQIEKKDEVSRLYRE